MKRFIDIGHQIYIDDKEPKQFSFYCTSIDNYEEFNGENVWDNANDFATDYLKDRGLELQRYLELMPNEFKICICAESDSMHAQINDGKECKMCNKLIKYQK